MKIMLNFASLIGLAITLAACGSDRTVVVQPAQSQPTQVDHVDHVVVEHAD